MKIVLVSILEGTTRFVLPHLDRPNPIWMLWPTLLSWNRMYGISWFNFVLEWASFPAPQQVPKPILC
jgi:hypothetical protein